MEPLKKRYCKRCIEVYGLTVPADTQDSQSTDYAREVYTSPAGHRGSYCSRCQSEVSSIYQRTQRLLPYLDGEPSKIPDHARQLLAEHCAKQAHKCFRYDAKNEAFTWLYKRLEVLTGVALDNESKLQALKAYFTPSIRSLENEHYISPITGDELFVEDKDVTYVERALARNSAWSTLRSELNLFDPVDQKSTSQEH